jgi:hypothetical protein
MPSTLDPRKSFNNSCALPLPHRSGSGLTPPASYERHLGEDAGHAAGGEAASSASLPLPCLYSVNSIEGDDNDHSRALAVLEEIHSSNHRKAATSIAWNVCHLVEIYGLENVGFLTLTFPDHVTCARVAQRRFNSLMTNALRPRYRDYVWCLERTKTGRVHFHLVVALDHDIRTGFDFHGVAKRDYSTANAAIRSEWAFLRRTVKAYGFGRTELLPIKSTAEGISRYVGKYLGKDLMAPRLEADRRMRRYGCSDGARLATTRFQFHTEGARTWRQKVAAFAKYVHTLDLIAYHQRDALSHHLIRAEAGRVRPAPIHTLQALTDRLGPRWAYLNREAIAAMPTHLDDLTLPGYFASYEKRTTGGTHEETERQRPAEGPDTPRRTTPDR